VSKLDVNMVTAWQAVWQTHKTILS